MDVCVTATDVAAHSCSRDTPSARTADAACSDHPSPRTSAPCGVSGASRSPSSTGSRGHPSNGASVFGDFATNRRHSAASASYVGWSRCFFSRSFSSESAEVPSGSGNHATAAPTPTTRRPPNRSSATATPHASGSRSGRRDARPPASIGLTFDAAPIAPFAKAKIRSYSGDASFSTNTDRSTSFDKAALSFFRRPISVKTFASDSSLGTKTTFVSSGSRHPSPNRNEPSVPSANGRSGASRSAAAPIASPKSRSLKQYDSHASASFLSDDRAYAAAASRGAARTKSRASRGVATRTEHGACLTNA